MNKLLTISLLAPLFSTLLTSCSSGTGDDSGEGSTSNGPVIRQIAGTSAYGNAGSWSNNCLTNACARADASGNFLLAATVNESALMSSLIPMTDGTNLTLYSRYRFDNSITTSLVNINPSTDAILKIWSQVSQGQTLDVCAEDITCSSALLSSFSEAVENQIIDQLDTLMGDAWPTGRNPFDDIYVADPSFDALDDMHDHFKFIVSDTDFIVQDNDGEEILRTALTNLTRPFNLENNALTTEQRDAAVAIPPNYASQQSAITLDIRYAPTTQQQVPMQVTVNASRSSSINGELTFTHDLTLASGSTQYFTEDQIDTLISEGGDHIWVVTAIDPLGISASQGIVFSSYNEGERELAFGGEGSCVTPLSSLTANTLNICQEAANGSQNACDVISAGSVVLSISPAPCAHQTQNDGALLGVCTLTENEIRVFYYVNPERKNNAETFQEKQGRVNEQCSTAFEGDWSTTP